MPSGMQSRGGRFTVSFSATAGPRVIVAARLSLLGSVFTRCARLASLGPLKASAGMLRKVGADLPGIYRLEDRRLGIQ